MSEVFAFDDYVLDVARFELRRNDEPVDVQPKVLRLLHHLIVHRDRAVASDELLRELWPQTTVAATSLRRAVLGVRQALGDAGDSNATIRTVRGLGYQFVRPVRREVAKPDGAVLEPETLRAALAGKPAGPPSASSTAHPSSSSARFGSS